MTGPGLFELTDLDETQRERPQERGAVLDEARNAKLVERHSRSNCTPRSPPP